MTSELWKLGAAEAAAAIRSGRFSAAQLVESHLARLSSINPRLNAVTVQMEDSARVAAEAADRVIATGKPVGALHGVPVTIKENVDVAGGATTNGVAAFENLIADRDSPVVANLRRAGAIVIGRTNTPEFSLRWFTDNELRGATANPWSGEITCGGSSGGAAASLAGGIGAFAHGNDLGGSLRYPAYCCGLATIRPSLGRVPAFNASGAVRPPAMSIMSVQGPLGRSVADVRLALAAMAAPSSSDPLWSPAPLEQATRHRAARAGMCADPFGDGVDPAVRSAVDFAGKTLSDAGFEVEEISLPEVESLAQLWGDLLSSEIDTLLQPLIAESGSACINGIVDEFMGAFAQLDTAGYMHALMRRNRLVRVWLEWLDRYPLIVTPVSSHLPFPPGSDTAGAEMLHTVMKAQRILTIVNVLGLPAAVVPTGLADGVPIGVQIIGPRYREDLCLDAAQVIENAAGTLSGVLWQQMAATGQPT